MSDDANAQGAMEAIFWFQWGYWATLVMAVMGYAYLPPGSVRATVILTPILPAMLIASMAYWIYRDSDEYVRVQILRSVVVTALLVAFGTLALFIAELFGAAPVSAIWVNVAGWTVFNAQMFYILHRSR